MGVVKEETATLTCSVTVFDKTPVVTWFKKDSIADVLEEGGKSFGLICLNENEFVRISCFSTFQSSREESGALTMKSMVNLNFFMVVVKFFSI